MPEAGKKATGYDKYVEWKLFVIPIVLFFVVFCFMMECIFPFPVFLYVSALSLCSQGLSAEKKSPCSHPGFLYLFGSPNPGNVRSQTGPMYLTENLGVRLWIRSFR